ncbi:MULTISPECIES: hypothetical protein [unclassified Frankia]|uniref:hypothetical protein n=1 Tax=unclassified Frankia TaxID=2632575 RepID=UPI002AD1E075|nr:MULTISPECIES: hypothetical protein [unclassified Frankia]
MTDAPLLDRAATCYLRAGQVAEAARCYRDAGLFPRSAGLYAQLGRHRDAAADYTAAGLVHVAAWTLAHEVGDPAAARALLLSDPAGPAHQAEPAVAAMFDALLRRLVLARCDVADGLPDRHILPVLVDVQAMLAEPTVTEPAWPAHSASRRIEEWAVVLAEAAHRYDQVALVFAAAVRGRRTGAEQRWAEWSARVLHTELTLPTGAVPPTAAGPTTSLSAG